MSKKQKQKILLIGWDAADWKAIHPMMDAGLMPNLNRFVNEGTMGNLATLDPPLSPMLWTSIATGKRPYKHGIWGFSEPRPDGKGIRPVLNTSRTCKAIWNMLTQEGYKTHAIGWWPSHPAEPINGVAISNFYQKAKMPKVKTPKENEVVYDVELNLDKWPLMDGTVHPPEKADLFAKLRVHPYELTTAHVQPFVPNGHLLDQTKKPVQARLNSVRKIIADCSTIHSAATYILENEEWDFVAVYYDAIDHFGHGFMKFHPPKRPHISQEDYDAYNYVVTAGYRYHDMMLGRLLDLVDDDTTVMLISDHGFHPDHNRPTAIPKIPAGPAEEHSPYGIIVAKGPNIKKDERVYGASLLDITPTLLAHLNLPVAKDMDGKVLQGLFEQAPNISQIDSWENVPGECGMHAKDKLHDPYMDKEALDQLIELGYIDKPDENVEKAIRKTVNENHFWLAKSYMDARKYEEALPFLQDLFENNPDQTRYGFRLSQCYQNLHRAADARQVLQALKSYLPDLPLGLMVQEAKLHLLDKQPQEALEILMKAEAKGGKYIENYLVMARCYMDLKQWLDAERAYQKVLKIDPESARSFLGLGLTYFHSGRYEEAAENFISTIALLYFQPIAHFYLGETLYKLGDFEAAAHAYEVCLQMNKGNNRAKQRLAQTYQKDLKNTEKAAKVEAEWLGNLDKEMVIVSGLPRSGTSMMMQLLEKGGIPIFTDKIRTPDDNNPKGYYEHEAIKKLHQDKKILQDIENGQGVKIIAQLLLHLPLNSRYKIIFMERTMEEVVQSQSKMLDRLAKEQGKTRKKERADKRLLQAFNQTLTRVEKWQSQLPNVAFLRINYNDTLKDPQKSIQTVNEFLGGKLDTNAMQTVVDKRLYREKKP